MSKRVGVPRLSIDDVKEITGLSGPTIRRHVATGKLRAYKVGRVIRIHEDDLGALYEEIRTA
ncbi:helix-turn-helix domain-containing protein [Brevibacterium casei]|uniref:Helix-turn-helix domain-containing protein n=1 Tax=Brevibacterium casei TaxID=33889 RepID=A0A7T2TH41_9MICO|nr:helix-turn-helix domain-containing protein [Brevibacterium casei]